jgi:hypothetical protein
VLFGIKQRNPSSAPDELVSIWGVSCSIEEGISYFFWEGGRASVQKDGVRLKFLDGPKFSDGLVFLSLAFSAVKNTIDFEKIEKGGLIRPKIFDFPPTSSLGAF